MDWLARLRLLVAALGWVACGAPVTVIPSNGVALAPGARPAARASGLRWDRAVSRGSLSYAVAFAGQSLVSVELATRFELVVRELTPTVRERARVSLGEAAFDVLDLALSPDGGAAYVAVADGHVREVDLSGQRQARAWQLGAAATAVAVSRDGRYLATGDATGVVCLRRRSDAALLQCVAAHPGPVGGLAFGDDRLASASYAGEVTIWDMPSLAVRRTRGRRGSANAVAFAPDGRTLAVGWSLAPPRPASGTLGSTAGPGAPDPFATVEIWSEDALVICDGHAAAVTDVAWTADGTRVVSSSWDRSVRLWDPGAARLVARLAGFDHLIRGVATDPDGRFVAIAAWAPALDAPATTLAQLLYPP